MKTLRRISTVCAGLFALGALTSCGGGGIGAVLSFIWFTSDRVGATNQIFRMQPNGTNVVQLTNEPLGASRPAVRRDGSLIAFQGSVDIVGPAERPGEPPVEDSDGVSLTGFESHIFTMNSDGSNVTRVSALGGNNLEPAFSPDGSTIVFIRDGEVWTMGANGSNPTQLTNLGGSCNDPTFSPNGARIAFESGTDIWVMDADGSNQVNVTNDGDTQEDPAWTRDGNRIVFETNEFGSPDEIAIMNADGTNRVRLTTNTDSDQDPVIAPDNSKIIFYRVIGGDNEVFTMNLDGSGQTNITNNAAFDRFPAVHQSP